MADPHLSPHWELLVLVPLEDLEAQRWQDLCLAPKIHQRVSSEACPRPTIMTHGTVYTAVSLGSLLAPAGRRGQTSGMRGIERRTWRGETFLTSRMKRTETTCCMADNL